MVAPCSSASPTTTPATTATRALGRDVGRWGGLNPSRFRSCLSFSALAREPRSMARGRVRTRRCPGRDRPLEVAPRKRPRGTYTIRHAQYRVPSRPHPEAHDAGDLQRRTRSSAPAVRLAQVRAGVGVADELQAGLPRARHRRRPDGVGADGARGHGLRVTGRYAARDGAVRRPGGTARVRHLRDFATAQRRTQLHRGGAVALHRGRPRRRQRGPGHLLCPDRRPGHASAEPSSSSPAWPSWGSWQTSCRGRCSTVSSSAWP